MKSLPPSSRLAPSPRLAALCLALAAVGPAPAAAPVEGSDPMQAGSWEIGPIIGTRNYSVSMPPSPSPHRDGWSFDFPQPDQAAGHVHYVTFRHGSLKGKTRIVLKYRIEAAPGVEIVPKDYPGRLSALTLYFQRAGDNWSGTAKYETYRWWATVRKHRPLTAGVHELTVRFDENWTAVTSSTAQTRPAAFRNALRDADRVGLTFGGGNGWGHGVYATGPARFVVTGFEVL